jgi:hypothetical protein
MTTPTLAEHVKGKGRHYRHPATGELVPSITNVIGVLDKPALPRWSAKLVAETAYRMRHSLPGMEEAEAVDMLKSAPWSKASRAADRGTDIHAYLECLMHAWEPQQLTGEALRYKQAADAWYEYYTPELIETELTVFNALYAGTGDLWCRIEGRLAIVDFKTSRAIYDEAALQLAALYGCTTEAGGGKAPHVGQKEVDLLVVRIGEDGFEVKQVADPAACLDAFYGLLAAWKWKHGKAYL